MMFHFDFSPYLREGNPQWQAIREAFAMDPEWAFFDHLLLASHPKWVRDSLAYYQKMLDFNPGHYWEEQVIEQEDHLSKKLSNYTHCPPEDLGITTSATVAMGLVYSGLKLPEGSEILCTDHSHYSQLESIRYIEHRFAYEPKLISLYEDSLHATTDSILKKIDSQITPHTRILALTWVHSSSGYKLPISEICEYVGLLNNNRAQDKKIYVLVDGVHGFGIEKTPVKELGCDGFFASCHKWIFGPRGTGFFYLKPELAELIHPLVPPYDPPIFYKWMQKEKTSLKRRAFQLTPGGFHSFEYRWSLAAALDFHILMGVDRIHKRSICWALQIKNAMLGMPHVRLHTPLSSEQSSSIVCLEIDGLNAYQAVDQFKNVGIAATATPYHKVYARLTPSIKNTQKEVEKVISALGNMGGKSTSIQIKHTKSFYNEQMST